MAAGCPALPRRRGGATGHLFPGSTRWVWAGWVPSGAPGDSFGAVSTLGAGVGRLAGPTITALRGEVARRAGPES